MATPDTDDLYQELLKKVDGTFWDRINDLWDFKEEAIPGFLKVFNGMRKSKPLDHHKRLLNLITRGEGIETLLEESSVLEEGSVFDAESVHTVATEEIELLDDDNAGTKNHSRKYLKTLRGKKIRSTNKSKAHLIPNDTECNQFWLPELKMVMGADFEVSGAPGPIMQAAARMHTNKLVFDMEHNHYFEDLQYGNILAIPLFDSLADMGAWKYKTPYEMLIVCDQAATYEQIGINGTEAHVKDATREDVRHATDLLSKATKMLAESLETNWDGFYDVFDEEEFEKKKVIKKMHEKLMNDGKVKVPVEKLDNTATVKLYKISFGALLQGEEERKYIPDPLLLLIKAAVNLSGRIYGKGCKLLPACKSESSVSSSGDIVSQESGDILVTPRGSTGLETKFHEIRIVSDDEDDLSVCSDITYSDF